MPCVLPCLTCLLHYVLSSLMRLVPYVLSCLTGLMRYLLSCCTCPVSYLFSCLTCLVLTDSCASRASCHLVSYVSRALLAFCRTCLESDVPLAKRAPVSYVSYVLLYLTYLVLFLFLGCSWFELCVLLCCSSLTCYLVLTISIHYIHYE